MLNESKIMGAVNSLNLQGVWQNDDVSPTSYLLSHKGSNPVTHWTRNTTTRVFPVRDPSLIELEVLIH